MDFCIDLGRLIGFHLIRFVLYVHDRHELPCEFAVRGEIGDIVVASLAAVLLYFASSKPALIVWNFVGLADISLWQ